MSTFSCPITITDMNGGEAREVEALVDTGAFYTTLPRNVLSELGVEPNATQRFRVADGRIVYFSLGEARVQVNGKSVATIVAFGEEGGPTLLGAYTLEGLAMAVDPFAERLVPRDVLPL